MSSPAAFGQSSTGSCSSDAIIAYVLCFQKSPCRVLTTVIDDACHLPTFTYESEADYSPSQCCNDLASSVKACSRNPTFQTVAELLPREDDGTSFMYNPDGRVHLLLVTTPLLIDFACTDPNEYEWTDARTFHDLLCTEEYTFEYQFAYVLIVTLLQSCANSVERLSKTSPSCQHTWIEQGAPYLRDIVRSQGLAPTSQVQRHAWASMSLLFKVNTSGGWFYIKSSPPGCPEQTITKCIANLFAADTVDVVAVDESLRCFVTREFLTVPATSAKETEIALGKLAKIQTRAIQHIDELKSNGVLDCSLANLAEQVDDWIMHPTFSEIMRKHNLCTEDLPRIVRKLCAELDSGNMPMTLVHGDFQYYNWAHREAVSTDEGMFVFDWERACISHPFCDLATPKRFSEKGVHQYLQAWAKYIHPRKARHLLEIAATLAPALHISTTMREVRAAPWNHFAYEMILWTSVRALLISGV